MKLILRALVVLLLIAAAVVIGSRWERVLLLTGWGLPVRTGEPMLIIAHRGNMADLPEDTAEAILNAAQMGADGIEFDVHESADGTWWVMHDPTVDRTTDGTGAIRDLADPALQGLRIDAGPGFDPASTAVFRPPRLIEVLDALSTYRGELYLDLQHAIGTSAAELIREVRRTETNLPVIVICRDEADVAAVRRAGPDFRAIIRVVRSGPATAADGFLLEAVDEATPEALASLGLPATTYVEEGYAFIDEEAILRRAWAIGVRAFLTKHLADALAQRERHHASP